MEGDGVWRAPPSRQKVTVTRPDRPHLTPILTSGVQMRRSRPHDAGPAVPPAVEFPQQAVASFINMVQAQVRYLIQLPVRGVVDE